MARSLKKGSTGSDVLQLQKDLQAVGYYTTGKLDGIFGSMTDSAVRAFQKANKLKVDGVVGPKTRAALTAKINAKKGKKTGGTVQGTSNGKKGGEASVQTGRWNGHRFVVYKSRIFSFKDLTIKGSSELESGSDNKKDYAKRKKGNPAEVTITISLNTHAGCEVRNESLGFVKDASAGTSDYFYVGLHKVLPCKLMLVDASVKDVKISRNGAWISANVQLSMKQSSKFENWKDAQASATGSIISTGGSWETGDTGTAKKTLSGFMADIDRLGKINLSAAPVKTQAAVARANNYTKSIRTAAKKATPKKLTTISVKRK